MSESTITTPTTPTTSLRAIRLALIGVMLAMLLGMLDNAIVGTSMPTIVRDLGGASHLSWVVSAYALATAASTPVWGKLGDLYDRRRTFLVAIVIFLVGSALSGISPDMTALIGFRVLQGIGAGGLATGAFALIGALVPPHERGRFQGTLASLMAVGIVAGPLLGGVLTGHLGWRWAFYINLPLGIAALVWTTLRLHLPASSRRVGRARIDWLGIALMTVAVCALILGLSWGGSTYAWGSGQILGCAAVFVVLLLAFLAWERRTPEPLLPLRMFATLNVSLAAVMIFAAGAVLFGATLYLPLFQQTVQHATATSSGLLLLPMMLPVPIASTISGRVMSATGRYKVFAVAGPALLTLALALLATMSTSTTRLETSAYMAMAGFGIGFMMQIPNTVAQNSVEMRDMGAVSASTNLFRTIGGSVGVAIFAALLNSSIDGTHPADAAYLHAFTSGVDHLFVAAALITAVATAAALALKEVPLRSGGPGRS